MAVKFAAQERPWRVVVEEGSATNTYARFIIEPYERVMGHCIGNALRRALLTSLEAPGIMSFRMEAVSHEFMAVEGIVEDVTHMVLNLKGALLRRLLTDDSPLTHEGRFVSKVIKVSQEDLDSANGKVAITLGDLLDASPFEVVNPEHLIFTVTMPIEKQIDFRIGFGRGYVASEKHQLKEKMEGEIILDTVFSPVLLVNYSVENTRVGQDTDYDRLVLEVSTDGRLTPTEALSFAAQLLMQNFMVFEQLKEPQLVFEKETTEEDDDDILMDKLVKRIDEIELSVRATNCLSIANIDTLAELVCLPEKRMLEFRNFGKKSLYEIKAKLLEMSLYLGMDLSRFELTYENAKERIVEIQEERKARKKEV